MQQQQVGEGEVAPPLALVLAPTRELAIQIEEQAKALANGYLNFLIPLCSCCSYCAFFIRLYIRTASIVGGLPMANQIYRISNGVQVRMKGVAFDLPIGYFYLVGGSYPWKIASINGCRK